MQQQQKAATLPEHQHQSPAIYMHSAAVSEQHQTLLELLQSRAESVMHRGEQSQHSSLPRRPACFYPDLLSQALFNKLAGSL